jgi:hypothetical protein
MAAESELPNTTWTWHCIADYTPSISDGELAIPIKRGMEGYARGNLGARLINVQLRHNKQNGHVLKSAIEIGAQVGRVRTAHLVPEPSFQSRPHLASGQNTALQQAIGELFAEFQAQKSAITFVGVSGNDVDACTLALRDRLIEGKKVLSQL